MCLITKCGCHIEIAKEDIVTFKEVYPNIDIHKNNPTVLYIPNSI